MVYSTRYREDKNLVQLLCSYFSSHAHRLEPDTVSIKRPTCVQFGGEEGAEELHRVPFNTFTRRVDENRRLTRAASLAATTMQIQLLDHLIMGAPAECRAGYFSSRNLASFKLSYMSPLSF